MTIILRQVSVQFVNPQASTPYFTFYADVRDSESVKDVIVDISAEINGKLFGKKCECC